MDNHDLGDTIIGHYAARDTKDKIEVMQAYMRGEAIQFRYMSQDPNDNASWTDIGNPSWNWGVLSYRVKPEEITYDTMDWSNIHEDYKYVARDRLGSVYLYVNHPSVSNNVWMPSTVGEYEKQLPRFFTGHKVGNCDWKDSLIKRDVEN